MQVRNWAENEGVIVNRVAVMPSPFSPLHRRGMVVSGEKVFLVQMTVFLGAFGDVAEYANARSDARLQPFWDTESGAIYGWFVRFPIVEEITGERNFLRVQDLQFMPTPDGLGWLGSLATRMVLDHGSNLHERVIFALEVELEAAQKIEKVTYVRQNGVRHTL